MTKEEIIEKNEKTNAVLRSAQQKWIRLSGRAQENTRLKANSNVAISQADKLNVRPGTANLPT
jgi:hypothetical protein